MLSHQYGAITVLASAIFLLLTFPTANGIKCYQCNSVNNTECINLEIYSRQYPYLEPTECVGDFEGQEPFCSKAVYGFEDNVGEYFTRTVRGCSWLRHKNPCYRLVEDTHEDIICQCSTDGCNAAEQVTSSVVAPLLLPFIITIYK